MSQTHLFNVTALNDWLVLRLSLSLLTNDLQINFKNTTLELEKKMNVNR